MKRKMRLISILGLLLGFQTLFAQQSLFIEPAASLTGSFSQNVQKTPFLQKHNEWYFL
ncbi:MAG: hypothetical protein NZ516_01310 [Raineya sp.]|nr:hypothetical protein [Raineya sp.]